ncbi:Spy/CpxP family protein refolding chaperone [Polaromonas jejuensis]|uniref:Spy/CpxP family protein refolding chaperone n=1 Tax=Polaromonas jejuensis TaxID=457502 RepID=A0ABW0QAX6_9BURK|nr:Spy/CpxP family protein refolding chaperone [Polaromonas jejuensis]
MQFALKPLAALNGLVLAGLLATAGAGAMAQGTPAAPAAAPAAATKPAAPHDGDHRMGRHDPAKMQAWMAKRQAELKAKLKITASQEGAWTTYTEAMKPPARMGERLTAEQRAEFDKLTTPERIDKMRALRTQRMAEMSAAMDKRGEATKAFYATLSPEQQKTFDAELKKHGPYGGRGGPRHHDDHEPKKG